MKCKKHIIILNEILILLAFKRLVKSSKNIKLKNGFRNQFTWFCVIHLKDKNNFPLRVVDRCRLIFQEIVASVLGIRDKVNSFMCFVKP